MTAVIGLVVIITSVMFFQDRTSSLLNGLRDVSFQVVSIITTTGFSTADYTLWGPFITFIFFLLLFSGASAGSTSGGIKIVRHVILLKNSYIELKKQLKKERQNLTSKNLVTFKKNVVNSKLNLFSILEKIKKLRNRTLILIGFGGGFRRTELISIDYEDLDFVEEGVKITLRRSKTDQFGEGLIKGLPYFLSLIHI